jgi:hypothetical protein
VDSVLVARLKATPDPTYYYGVFNVAPILKSYVDYEFQANLTDQTCINPAKLNYQVKIGEEYEDTLYTNLLVDSSRSAFKSYAVRPFDSSAVVTDGAWASNSPAVLNAYRSQKWLFLNYYEDDYPGGEGQNIDVVINAYLENGTLLDSGQYVDRPVTDGSFLQINGSPYKAGEVATTDTASYYTINVSGVTKRVNLMCDGKYPLVQLAWLNQYGGYESYGFGLVSRKDMEVTRKHFAQLPYRLNASGVQTYSANGVFYGSKRGFSSEVITRLKVTSHLLTDEEYEWLKELFVSSDVYMYSDTLSKFFPVSVRENQYEVRTYANSRLKPLEFSVEFDNYNGQYL